MTDGSTVMAVIIINPKNNLPLHYKDGKLDGENTYYDKNGKIYWKGIYKDDVLVNETSFIGSKGPFRLN